MADTLLDFLATHDIENETARVLPSARFPEPFTIKTLTQDGFEQLQKQCKTYNKKNNSTDYNAAKFSLLCVEECCISPNFRDAMTLKKLGLTDGSEFIKKRLKPGEIAELASQIAKLSGFDSDINDLVAEAKN